MRDVNISAIGQRYMMDDWIQIYSKTAETDKDFVILHAQTRGYGQIIDTAPSCGTGIGCI